ncbi:MAG: hypothetical protein U0793_24870 [Gemmataceae bacterium]
MRLSLLSSLLVCFLAAPAFAHPVPRDEYDQTTVVRLKPGAGAGELLLQIDFRLEVDPQTVILKDMRPFRDEIDLNKVKTPADYMREFTRLYANVYGRNYYAKFNGAEVKWTCVRSDHTLKDEDGKSLDHLRCDFRYEANVTLREGLNELLVRNLNYQDYPGKLLLSFGNDAAVKLVRVVAPDASVQALALKDRSPDDEYALRTVHLRFERPVATPAAAPVETGPAAIAPATSDTEEPGGLLHLFLNSDFGLPLMLLLAAGIGAVHALTPGHGKTMVAAYLVGERGTVAHAVFLGVVTTITHTGIVLLVAGVLFFLPEGMSENMRQSIQLGLGLVMGLAIAGLGLFLLLQRLAGRADHFHVGGGHHHHHGHHHHGHEPGRSDGEKRRFGWWALTLLGVSGGLIPCWDAIALLVLAVGMNLFWLALPVLLAFSAGLASVLVLIGIAVVKFRGILGDRWGEGRLVRALPILSAIVVTLMGFWICYEAVNGKGL